MGLAGLAPTEALFKRYGKGSLIPNWKFNFPTWSFPSNVDTENKKINTVDHNYATVWGTPLSDVILISAKYEVLSSGKVSSRSYNRREGDDRKSRLDLNFYHG